jgi:hypothetical protein
VANPAEERRPIRRGDGIRTGRTAETPAETPAEAPAETRTKTPTKTPTETPTNDEDVRRIAAGGGTIPSAEDDRARRATVPSWDDILLGVRRKH